MREYFPKLLGCTDAKLRVGMQIESGRAPHAFLISGPQGSGKRTMATEIAAALNCKASADKARALPCGACESCLKIYAGAYPDLKILEKPKDRATLGVSAVKDLREDMFLSATEADFKVYVIDDAETMTPEAQNALLKVLEEPPRGVVIILLATEADKILTTIKSRVQFVVTERFTPEVLKRHLIKLSDTARRLSVESPTRLDEAVMSADGVLGAAIKLTEDKHSEARIETRKTVERFLSAAASGSQYSAIREAISDLPEKRDELRDYLELTIKALADIISVRMSREVRCKYFITREDAQSVAAGASTERLFSIYDAINEAYSYLERNANVQNLLTNLSLRLR